MSLRKFEIHFDEDKVRADNVYSLEHLYYTIDEVMREAGIEKIDNGVYQAKTDSSDYEVIFGSMIIALSRHKWFIKYADKWKMYYDGHSEDVLESYNRIEAMVGE